MKRINEREKRIAVNNSAPLKIKLKSADNNSGFAENIVNTVREPLIVLDQDLKVVAASRSFYDVFKVNPEETLGTLLYDLGNQQWNIPKLKELLETILPEKASFEDYEVEHDFTTIGNRVMLLNARQIKRAFGKEKIILLAIEDITERRLAEKTLSEKNRLTSEYLNILLDHAHAPIIIWDSSMRIKRFNLDFEKLSGYKFAEVIDKNIEFLFPKNKIVSTLKLIKNNLDVDNHEVIEIDILTKDKEIRTVLWNSVNILDEGGENIVSTIAQDITGRKESEEKFWHSFQYSSIGTCIVGIDKKFQRINNAFKEMLGYDEDEMKEFTFTDITHTDDLLIGIIQYEKLLAGDIDKMAFEKRYIRKDKEIVWVMVSTSLIRDSDKKPQFFITQVLDITDRKKLEANLSTAAEIAKLGYWEYNVASGDFTFNDQYYRLIHGSSTEKQGGNLMNVEVFAKKLIHPDDSSIVGISLQEAIESPNPNYFGVIETRVLLDNGDIANIKAQLKILKDSSGKTYKVYGNAQDITDRKIKEKELIEAKEKAEEMSRLKTSFLANMSHELRTPLIGILGNAEFLERELNDKDLIEMANTIKISGQRLNTTLNNILNISKIEAEKTKINMKELDLIKYLSEQTKLFKASAEEKGLSLNFETREEKLNAFIDEEMFISITSNLINNAIKFTQKGKITLRAMKQENNAVIEVEDTGIGIPEDLQEIVFDPFRQASEGHNRSFEGAGLGLAIVKKYMGTMGGTITMNSKPGDAAAGIAGGSTFILKFPLNGHSADNSIKTSWV